MRGGLDKRIRRARYFGLLFSEESLLDDDAVFNGFRERLRLIESKVEDSLNVIGDRAPLAVRGFLHAQIAASRFIMEQLLHAYNADVIAYA